MDKTSFWYTHAQEMLGIATHWVPWANVTFNLNFICSKQVKYLWFGSGSSFGLITLLESALLLAVPKLSGASPSSLRLPWVWQFGQKDWGRTSTWGLGLSHPGPVHYWICDLEIHFHLVCKMEVITWITWLLWGLNKGVVRVLFVAALRALLVVWNLGCTSVVIQQPFTSTLSAQICGSEVKWPTLLPS